MNSWEERLAAILPFTRSILAAACWKYSSFISMPIYLRPVRSAAAQVEADVTLYSNRFFRTFGAASNKHPPT